MRMQKDNHCVEIRPRGSQGQYTLEQMQILADDMSCATVEQADAINDARIAFAAECGLPHSRPNEVYRLLGHKAAFINSYKETITEMKIVDALLADRSSLFSSGYEDDRVNRSHLDKLLEQYGGSTQEAYAVCVERAWDKYCSAKKQEQIDKLEQMVRPMYESTLKALAEYARATRNGMQYYARELRDANENAPDGQEAQALVARIKKWVPDAALTENRAVDFYVRYFSAFMSAYREYRRLKEDHKKFEGQYMKRDAEALKQYLERRKCLNKYREFCTEWNSHSKTTFEVIGEWSDCSNVCDAEYLKKSVTAYLKATRGKNVPDMENIKEALQLARNAAKHTAFVFMLICIQKRDCIAARKDGKRDFDLDEVSFPENIYQEKPSAEKQRKARLLLLLDVCEFFHDDGETVRDNLLYFLKLHGYRILSEEEAELWKTTLEKYRLMDDPVSLAWRYYENAQQCLQFDPSDLYCCEAASPVQIDGFRALMKNAAFARYISGKSIHIKLSKELKAEYLEEWSSDCPNVTHIKAICRKTIENNEKKNIDAWIEKWNEQSRNGEHWMTREMNSDELYSVLMETIIQQRLIKDARDILLKKIDELMP